MSEKRPSKLDSWRENRPRSEQHQGIYFLAYGDIIKIGQATCVRERLRDIQAMSPVDLVPLGFIPVESGLYLSKEEAKWHAAYRASWKRGEWFTILPHELPLLEAWPTGLCYRNRCEPLWTRERGVGADKRDRKTRAGGKVIWQRKLGNSSVSSEPSLLRAHSIWDVVEENDP